MQHFAGPGDAMAAGIGMVHQHFMLIPVVHRRRERHARQRVRPASRGTLDLEAARQRGSREISERFGFHVDPDALVEDLPVGVQQRVEIIKALSRDAEVLVFDEPTAVLTPQETDELMDIMRQLKEAGHRDRLHHPQAPRGPRGRRPDHRHPPRQGRRRGRRPRPRNAELAALMVGRAVELTVAQGRRRRSATTALVVKDLRVVDAGRAQVRSTASASTIGPARSSPSPACRATARPSSPRPSSGLQDRRRRDRSRSTAIELVGKSTREILDAGVGFIPEDRQVDGLVGSFTIAENLMLDRSFTRDRSSSAAACSSTRSREFAAAEARGVRRPRPRTSTRRPATLSGGNQQKVVVARELSRDLRLLVAAQPTRGVDVGSIEFIHKQIVADPRPRASRCWSSPPSSTRSSRSPTASW